jgi:hypothetical protein
MKEKRVPDKEIDRAVGQPPERDSSRPLPDEQEQITGRGFEILRAAGTL